MHSPAISLTSIDNVTHMTSIDKELLGLIVANLRAFEVESLTRTFNKKFFDICLPLLTHRLALERNAKRMIDRFGCVRGARNISKKLYQSFDLESKRPGKYEATPSSASTRPNLDYLDLNGDLSWLQPLDNTTAKEMEPHHHGLAASNAQVDELIKDAERLNLALPDTFVRFIRDKDLQYRVPSCSAAYFFLGDGFRRCPPTIDKGAGGYIIRFLSDQQGCWYLSLYLDPSDQKGHCVLFSQEDPNHPSEGDEDERSTDEGVEMDTAKEEGPKLAALQDNDAYMAGTSFEECLASMYFEERIQMLYLLFSEVQLPPDLEEYVIGVYSGMYQS